jgi:hypothetical protein
VRERERGEDERRGEKGVGERGRALSSSSSSRVSGGSARKIFGKSIGDRRRAGARGGQRKQISTF